MIKVFSSRNSPGRVALDLLLGAAVFLALILLFAGEASQAFPLPPPAELLAGAAFSKDAMIPALSVLPPALPTPTADSRDLSYLLLGGAFASMFAINMALLRHLRAAYITADERLDA
jgi:hypothetical protein